MRRLRNTTLPGVTATCLPTSKASVPGAASAFDRAARVVEPVLEAADQILPGLGGRALQELGVGLQEVGRGGRLEQHAPGEIRPRECGGVRAGLRLQRFLPPGGPVGVGARIGVEGPDVPGFAGKTQLLVTGRQRLPAGSAGEELPAVERLFVRAAGEGGLPVRVRPEVQIPVPPGACVIIGGKSPRDRRELSPQLARDFVLRRAGLPLGPGVPENCDDLDRSWRPP